MQHWALYMKTYLSSIVTGETIATKVFVCNSQYYYVVYSDRQLNHTHTHEQNSLLCFNFKNDQANETQNKRALPLLFFLWPSQRLRYTHTYTHIHTHTHARTHARTRTRTTHTHTHIDTRKTVRIPLNE